MNKKLVFGGMVLAGFAMALIGAQAVLAHSRPIRFDPAPGAVLSSAPTQVTAWFTNELRRDPNWTFIHVTDSTGTRVDTGEPVVGPDRRQVSVGLKPGLPAGTYTIMWRTWDDVDREIFTDCYLFFVGQAAADAAVAGKLRLDGGGDCERLEVEADEATPTPDQVKAALEAADAPAASDDGDDGGVPVWSLIVAGALGLVVGGGAIKALGKGS